MSSEYERTLGGLKKSGWRSRSVKDELHESRIEAIRAGQSVRER